MPTSVAITVAERLLYVIGVGVIVVYLVNQLRRPSRWLGRPFLFYMNLSHSSVTDWGLQHVHIEPGATILDVGCGGGRTVKKLAALAPSGKIYGIDYAAGSVAASRATNSKLIATGQVAISQASVSQLPFPDDWVDLVTAVETQYYWPDVVKDMKEIRRVLRPQGRLMVIAETYRKGSFNSVDGLAMKLLKGQLLGVQEEKTLFANAGYENIEVWEEPARGWMCVSGTKPLDA